MAKKLRPDSKINGYKVVRHINTGQKALSYEAVASDGSPVFLKQYKSPTPTVPWYHDYVEYEKIKKRRIEEADAQQFCVRLLDIFEAEWGHKCFFQAFEFVERGHDLSVTLDKLHSESPAATWRRRLVFAKVMMAAVDAIHRIKLVHGDLKPANVQLVEDRTIKAGHQTKLIDMDASVLTDIQPPWHGYEGYVGTVNYHSPEHLTNQILSAKSDVFTCGLILYELLAGHHPYLVNDEEQYLRNITARVAGEPELLGQLDSTDATAVLRKTMHRCLSPKLDDRPSAHEVNLALNGRLGSTVAEPLPASRPPQKEKHRSRLVLEDSTGIDVCFNITTDVNQIMCRRFGADAAFLSNPQYTVRRDGDGVWLLVPADKTQNETLVNGKAVRKPTPLTEGDEVSIGRADGSNRRLPLRVSILS